MLLIWPFELSELCNFSRGDSPPCTPLSYGPAWAIAAKWRHFMNTSLNSWAKRGILVFDHPIKISTTALSFSAKRIWNRYHRLPSLAQAIVSVKKMAIRWLSASTDIKCLPWTYPTHHSLSQRFFFVPSGKRSYLYFFPNLDSPKSAGP